MTAPAPQSKPTAVEGSQPAEPDKPKVKRIRRIKCGECQQNYVEKRGEICEGCDAYREHTGHF